MRRHEPTPLRQALEEVATDLRTAHPDTLGELVRQWDAIVGPDLADVTRFGGLVDGVLTVLVDEPAVASAIRSRAGAVSRRLTERVGEGVASRLRVVVERPR